MSPASTRSYLDWNATAPLHPAAREAMAAALELVGNPSSPHAEGRAARAAVEAARERIAACLGASARNVYFTSGATEAANWVLSPGAGPAGAGRPLAALLLGATEHACVRAGHRFPASSVTELPVDGNGRIDLDVLDERLSMVTARHGRGAVMVALQAANSETGVLHPMADVAERVSDHGGLLVCDAVQALGRIAPPKADVLFFSAHKVGGPKGVGAVVFADDAADDAMSLPPLIRGGGQERRQRSGTENVAGIVGFAAALEAVIQAAAASVAHGQGLQDTLERGLKEIDGETVVFGAGAPRLANTTCFATPRVAAETALIALDLAGVSVSSGSACSSGKVAASHVLAAMRVPETLARGALRVSTGPTTRAADVEAFLEAWRQLHARRSQRAA